MARLIYGAIASLDGYIEDDDGNFNWGRTFRRSAGATQ